VYLRTTRTHHPPRLRTENDLERHATWLELFFDLVFVVAVASLAQELVADHSLSGFARVAGLFLPVFVAWQGFSLYSDRFDNDDTFQRIALFCGVFAVGILSVQIKAVANGATLGFAGAYIVLRLLTLALYGRAYKHNPIARPLLNRYIGGYSVSVLLWVGSLLVPTPLKYVLWGMGIATDLLMPPLSTRLIVNVPISKSHLSERFGLFTLLVMGESVVAVTLGFAQSSVVTSSLVASALGTILAATLWWLYFGRREGQELSPQSTGVVFAYAHIPLLLALTVIGAGIHLVIDAVATNELHLDSAIRGAIGVGAAVFLAALCLISAQQKRGIAPLAVNLRIVAASVVALCTFVGGTWSPIGWVASVAAILVVLVIAESLLIPDD